MRTPLSPACLALLGVVATIAPREAAAVELWGTGPFSSSTLLVNSSSIVRYRHVEETLPGFEDRNILDYVEQVQRLNGSLTKGTFTLGVQLDEVTLFANRYMLDDVIYNDRDLYNSTLSSPLPNTMVILEKGFMRKRWDHLDLTLGDSYATFGRGIALNVVRNPNIDIDTSIRGAKAEITAGDLGITLVSGLTNRQQINRLNINVGLTRDLPHMISGMRVEHYALGPFQAGVHGVVARFAREADRGGPALVRYEDEPDAVITGANVEAFGLLGADWYIEGDLFRYRTPEIAGQDDPLSGWMIYGSSTAYPGAFTILLEGKASKNTERINAFLSQDGWEMSVPPPLEYERVITEDSSAAVNSNDIYGGRVRADLSLGDGSIIPYASMMVMRDEDLTNLHFNSSPETIFHPITGGQFFPGEKIIIVNGGYRQDVRDDTVEGSDRMAHVDAEYSMPLFGDEGIEFAVSIQRFLWGNNPQGQEDFTSMNNAIVWKRGNKLDILFYQDWTDNPLIPATGNTEWLAGLLGSDWGDKLYFALEGQYKPTPSSQLTALIGSYKAGIRCSGGQCRTLPGFSGAEITYTTQF